MKAHRDTTIPHGSETDPNVPIYSGEYGYVTEAEKQALIASLDKAERDYQQGEWVDVEDVRKGLETLRQQYHSK